jgi:PHD/YefM family antitoxin component YafN of YafNO toxin-antitoxin module
MTDIDKEEVEKKSLQNPELVARILESAEQLSAPMSVDEFKAWLKETVS